MQSRLSIPGVLALGLGTVAFILENRFEYFTLSLGQIGIGTIGPVFGYSLAILGTLVGIQLLATKALAGSRASNLVRNRVQFPIEGIVYIGIMCVLFVGSFIGKSNPLLLLFCLMAAPLVFNGFIAYTQLRRIAVRREASQRGEAGQPIPITIVLSNRRRFWPVWMFTIKDRVDGPTGPGPKMKQPLEPQVAFLRVPKKESQRRVYRIKLPKRGRYQFGPLQADTRFPLGLIERGLIFPDTTELLVHPRIGTLSPEWRRRLARAQEQVARSQPRAGSFEDDFHRVRDYQTGDDPRSIHWPTSARRGALVVREFRESRDQPLAILVDLWSEDGVPNERVERALDLAATMAVDHSRTSQRANVFCALSGQELVTWDSSSWADLGGILDAMATATPSQADNAADLLDAWDARQLRDERVVWITTRDHGPSSGKLPPGLQVIVADEAVVADICHWKDG